MKFRLILCLFTATILAVTSCKKEKTPNSTETGKISVEFEHRVNNDALIFNTKTYKNANGDDFTVSTFKYYVSNIRLTEDDGVVFKIPESYYLVDASDPSSTIFSADNIPSGDYKSISFTIGVDAERNFAGAQTGALDPAKGMFWSWNSGYIFLMMEGISPQSTAAGNKLAFHIGGAKDPANCIRTFSTNFSSLLRVRKDKNPQLHFVTDAAALFKGAQNISFAVKNTMHGGADAVMIANNYVSGLFRLDHVHN